MFYSTSPALPNRFGVYVHTPFCVHKCSYCDFYSFTQYTAQDFAPFTDQLVREIASAGRWLTAQKYTTPVSTIFIGGGTPSLFPADQISRILAAIGDHFPWEDEVEITLEANPETVSAEVADALAATKLNRISLGAQSFRPEHLKTLERLGSPASIAAAIAHLKRAGFSRLNLDLIFGIPGQSPRELAADIASAAELGPEHISAYNLTLKPAHPLFTKLPTDDEAADLYELTVETLREAGYGQYEISNFCRPGGESRHNLLYWDGGDYLGVGPSAASRFFSDGRFYHRKQWSDVGRYGQRGEFPDPPFESSSPAQSVLEATFLELRKNEGVNVGTFRARYSYDLSAAKNFSLFVKEGLIEREGEIVRLTARGRLLADRVTRDLVDE